MATRYLKDTAMLWWRRQYGDIERGTATIDTWAEFIADFKKQFYPENAKNKAKSRLHKLKQSRTIREYVKEFTILVLEILKLSDQDTLFYFLDGLQGWAKTELERRGVQDLSMAIAHAEALIEFTRDCPKKASLNGMSAHEEEDASDGGSMGSIRILNAIKAKTEVLKVVGKGLQYVESTINGVKVRALVDSGATHKLCAVMSKRLGINTTKGSRTIKAVNSEAKPIHGVAKDVRAKIGEWEGTIDLSVVPMDDFKVVLGLEFLDKSSNSEMIQQECSLAIWQELPKKLPPKDVDHTIELETGPTSANAPLQNATTPCWKRLGESCLRFETGWGLDERCKDKGYPRVGIANQGYGVEIFSWLGELLPPVHHGILGHSIPFDGPIEEEQSLDMGRRVPSDVREFEEGGYRRADVETTGCDHAFRVTHGCIRLCYWKSSNAKWTPDRIREPEVKRDGKEVHGARERDDSDCPLLEDFEALFVGLPSLVRLPIGIQARKANVVADALSRKAEFAAINQAQFFLQDRIKEGLEHDPLAKKIIALAKDGEDPEILAQGRHVIHQKRLALHRAKEVGRIARAFNDTQGTMGECFHGLYHMLAKIGRGGSIIVVVEQFSKSEIHRALLDEVVQDHGDGFKLLHEFSSQREPDKTDEGDALLELYLRHYCDSNEERVLLSGHFPGYWNVLEFILSSLDTTAQVKIYRSLLLAVLKPYHGDEEDPERGVSKWAPTTVVTSYDREVEEILSDRTIRRRGVPSYKEYLIKWRDLPNSEASWEAEDLLWQFAGEIRRVSPRLARRRTSRRLQVWEDVTSTPVYEIVECLSKADLVETKCCMEDPCRDKSMTSGIRASTPNGKGVVRATGRGLDMALHWSEVGAASLTSPRQDETNEPLLYARWMAGPYRYEATSSLGSHLEKTDQEALTQASVGRTTIIVAHRLSILRDTDLIIVIQSREVINSVSHGQLIKNKIVFDHSSAIENIGY
ncbi:putative retrotransposon gag domain, aspartic peptidase domain protein [Tanacetum coccineum]